MNDPFEVGDMITLVDVGEQQNHWGWKENFNMYFLHASGSIKLGESYRVRSYDPSDHSVQVAYTKTGPVWYMCGERFKKINPLQEAVKRANGLPNHFKPTTK